MLLLTRKHTSQQVNCQITHEYYNCYELILVYKQWAHDKMFTDYNLLLQWW